jgi:hypothetical protein
MSQRIPSPRALLVALALSASSACGPREERAPEVNEVKPVAKVKPTRLDGRVRLNDVWLELAPLVAHDAKMDLRTRCRIAQDEAKEAGRPVPPLCFEDRVRDREAIVTVRVERWPSLPVAIRTLTATAEGAHFVIERTGSVHQTLDLAFAARRQGEVRPGEIRILAAEATAGAALAEALVGLFPGARVEQAEGLPIPEGPEGDPNAKPVIAPTKPPAPHDHGDHGDHQGHDHGDHAPGDGHDH